MKIFFPVLLCGLFYFASLPPTVASYRDCGELALGANTLGVLHPPGYPLYALMGKLFTVIYPVGNTAYRLNAMSLFFSLFSLFLLGQILLRLTPHAFVVPFLVLFFGLSPEYFQLALVSESYAPDIFFVLFLLYLAIKKKNVFIFSFCAGIFLTNRLSLLLIYPVLFLPYLRKENLTFSGFIGAVLCFAAGFSFYAYLPIRSLKNPFLDWADPQNLSNFVYSLTRKAYGHSLDRISEMYRLKEVLLPQLKFFLFSLLRISPLLIPFGMFSLLNPGRDRLRLSLLLAFLLSGPFFLAISRMPTNPHAMAIVSASYPVPQLFFMILSLFSFNRFFVRAQKKAAFYAKLLLVLSLFFSFSRGVAMLGQRRDYFAWEYAENIFKSAGPRSAVFLRKDVQLFSVWYYGKEKKKETPVIAQGMARAFWYREQLERNYALNLPDPDLSSAEYFRRILDMNPLSFYSTANFEADPGFHRLIGSTPRGLVYRMESVKKEPFWNFSDFYFFRSIVSAGVPDNFYWKDLQNETAQALNSMGLELFFEKKWEGAELYFKKAVYFSPEPGMIQHNLGIIYFQQGRYEEGEKYYRRALRSLSRLHRDRRTAPVLNEETSKVYNNLGTLYEKKNELDEALRQYEKAIELFPNFGQAYYNTAVVYWKQEKWRLARTYLEKTLQLEPDHEQARYFLSRLMGVKSDSSDR